MTTAVRPSPGAGFTPGQPDQAPFTGPFARFSPYAWLLPPELWGKLKRWFIYGIDHVTPNQMPASASVTNTVGINRDAHFCVVGMAATVTNVDNTTLVDAPSFTLTMKDSGSGSDLMDKAQHFLNIFNRGSAGDGKTHYLELPRLFDPGAVISMTLNNLDATARHVRVSFVGFKVFGLGG